MSDRSDNNQREVVATIGHTLGKGQRTSMLQHLPPAVNQHGWFIEEETPNWPRCGHCKSLARPAIWMFNDFTWKWDKDQEMRWHSWKEAVLESEDAKVCIVEIGCGVNVSTCRNESEYMVTDLLKKRGNDDSVSLVRINADFPLTTDERVGRHLIPILSTGLRALQQIDEIYQTRLTETNEAK